MARYFLRYRHSDNALVPVFTYFKKVADLSDVTPQPGINGPVQSDGSYYFDYIPAFDICFEADGGASITDIEIRYISETIGPGDTYIDEPVSQVKDDVWDDAVNRATGSKGDFVEHIGINTDAVDAATVFGKIYKARDVVLGGTGFGGTGIDVKTTYDRIGAPVGASISADIAVIPVPSTAAITTAVWNDTTVSAAGTKGAFVQNVGAQADAVNDPTVFGQTYKARDVVLGGTGFGGTGIDVKTTYDRIGAPAGASIAADIAAGGGGGGGPTAAAIAGAVWDEAIASHLAVGSTGEKLNSGGVSAGTLAAAVWDEAISAHVADGSFGSTLQLLTSGTAQGGTSTNITLAVGASATDDFYKNALLVIVSGAGAGQARSITAYSGTTKIATVDRAWGVTVNGTSHYMVIPAANTPIDGSIIAGAVWDVALASHLTAGSTGAKLNTAGTPYVQFEANGDTVAPVILQVASPTHTSVRITFSEPVVMTTGSNGALNISNYSIPGLTIVAISALTAQQVLLTTSAQAPLFLYTLSVANVEDLQGNVIV
jgi:hypothetical protein